MKFADAENRGYRTTKSGAYVIAEKESGHKYYYIRANCHYCGVDSLIATNAYKKNGHGFCSRGSSDK